MSGAVLGWLYIISRITSRIAEINDRLIRLVPSGFIFFMLSPLVLVTMVWVNHGYVRSWLLLDCRAFGTEHPAGAVLAGIGWSWMLYELVRRQVRRCIRSYRTKQLISRSECSVISHRALFKKLPQPAKAIYSLASFLPGNCIDRIRTTRYEIAVAGLSKGKDRTRIVQLTDVHYSGEALHYYYEHLVSQVNALRPDILVLTGDVFQQYESMEHFTEVLSTVHADTGVFYVCGNHEYWDGIEPALDALNSLGFIHLAGTVQRVCTQGTPCYLAGTDFPWRTDTLREQIAALPDDAVCIVLSHDPDNVKWLQDNKIKLILSGHTHGGQIALPALGPFVIPSRNGSGHAAGFVPYGTTLLYVNYGAGLHLPIRMLCPLEIAVFDLVGQAGPAGSSRAA
jgi:predicted MPP superfamily phosphohydrolase